MFALGLLAEGTESPDTTLQWMLIVALVFFGLMVVVGWWVGRNGKPGLDVQHQVQDHHEVDDLLKIEGISPKVAEILGKTGIKTFEGLAHTEISSIKKVLEAAGMQMMDPEGWIDQAKLAAKGDWAALEKLQSDLNGGRKAA